jgi:hypothetical protein
MSQNDLLQAAWLGVKSVTAAYLEAVDEAVAAREQEVALREQWDEANAILMAELDALGTEDA